MIRRSLILIQLVTMFIPVSISAAEAPKPNLPATVNIPLVSVPGGCFKMGDTFGDGFENEKPVHDVCLSDFMISKFEITQGQWKQIMGNNPAYFKICGDDCPIENVNWDDVQEFISRLNKASGKEYRLPTEAEWEYACRSGGKSEKFCGGNDVMEVAWYFSTAGDRTHPGGMKRANGLGIFDMSGNVWELVNDWYDDKYPGIKDNPQGPATGTSHVIRGGGWYVLPRNVRGATRSFVTPTFRGSDVGFRLVMPAPAPVQKQTN
jgi:formylglycine-generating enzyme required for sulfatase activity